jgi:hypothetical protein
MRSSVEDVEHRFFLALLLNLEERTTILAMIAEKISGDPLETLLRWAEEITLCSESGVWILDAQFPEEWALSDEESSEIFLAALGYFLSGGKVPEILKRFSSKERNLLHESFMKSSWRVLNPS